MQVLREFTGVVSGEELNTVASAKIVLLKATKGKSKSKT
jgi:hypothetical protein